MSATSLPTSPFRDDILANKVALITGGGSGIGLEITRQLGLHGARVVITGRRQHVLDAAVAELGQQGITALAVAGDIKQKESCERWVAEAVGRFGRLDILVNCAAGNFLAPAEQLTQNGFRVVIETDAIGTFTMSRSAFPALKQSGDACIINISAAQLLQGAFWWQTHLVAAKSAVDGLTRNFALEWGEFGIRVNSVGPGAISDTAGLTKLAPGAGEQAVQQIPLGRLGEKWDIGMTCVFLASPAARYISGTFLAVDGAGWMWRPQILPREAVSRVSRQVEKASRDVGVATQKPQSKL